MAKRFVELDALSMMGALVALAEPVDHLANDEELWNTFTACVDAPMGKTVPEQFRSGLQVFAKLIPLLLNDQHRHDTLQIMSIIEGKSVKELSQMDGAAFIKDILEAWNKELKAFFTKSGLSARKE